MAVMGAPVLPANMLTLVLEPESTGESAPVGTLKYMIILSPGFNDVGPAA